MQSIAMAGRKTYTGWQYMQADRPPKTSYIPEHMYNVGSAPKSTLLPRKKRKASYNLSHFVFENKSGGKIFFTFPVTSILNIFPVAKILSLYL